MSGKTVSEAGAQTTLQDALSPALPRLASMLATSKALHVAIITRAGSLSFANEALAECLQLGWEDLAGRSFRQFLTVSDADSFLAMLAGAEPLPEGVFLLNLVDSDQVPHTMCCRIAPIDDAFLLVAEPPQQQNESLQRELLRLNNQLAVLTRESTRTARELARALAELKKTQSMLVHQEKMASLGQMTAGIAHEINNPLAFVTNNEQVLRRDFDDLLAFVNAVGDLLPEIASLAPHAHAEILAKAHEVGLEYLAESVPRKISANIEGLERVKKIILDMRSFSRLDEAERKLCDPAEGILSSVRFLGPLMEECRVTIETELAPLAPLFCAPGALNQAVSNILINAIQASRPGQSVRVVTREEGAWYCIEVTDQGCGIPAEQLPRVFDPFFTTKPVGSGTGLGLSIVHQVVEAHQGRIEIDSSPEKGTTVRILLPREQP